MMGGRGVLQDPSTVDYHIHDYKTPQITSAPTPSVYRSLLSRTRVNNIHLYLDD